MYLSRTAERDFEGKSEKKLLKMSVIDTLKNCGYDTYPAPLQKDDKPDSWHKFEKTATI